MGFFKSLFGGSNTPETEKEKNKTVRSAYIKMKILLFKMRFIEKILS